MCHYRCVWYTLTCALVACACAAAKTKLVVNMLLGGVMVALSESYMLADKAGVSADHLQQILALTSVGSPLVTYVCRAHPAQHTNAHVDRQTHRHTQTRMRTSLTGPLPHTGPRVRC
jgi:3-hydroxyisobutyrate dehydrogenase-like beta-hydroxyacid dehydrogenase